MTNPRRPDDVRLSTADLARATERAQEQRTETNAGTQPHPPTPPVRQAGDRDVTPAVQNSVIADNRAARTPHTDQNHPTPLFAGNEAEELRHRWQDIQTGFVDEPRQAVERADALVATAIKRLAEMFANERNILEQQWSRGDDVSTEDLRVALRRYRGFFDRLLSI